MVHRGLVYIFLLNVPSFSSRYFNKIKRTSRLGRLLALSLEILSLRLLHTVYHLIKFCIHMHVNIVLPLACVTAFFVGRGFAQYSPACCGQLFIFGVP